MNQIKTALSGMLPGQKKAPGPEPTATPPKKTPPAPGEGQALTLVAWAMPVTNTRLLVAYKPGADPTDPTKLVSVMVRSNVNFMKGMELTATPVRAGVYDLVGTCPRMKGRW